MKEHTFRLFVVLCVTVLLGSCAKSPDQPIIGGLKGTPDQLIIGEWEGTDNTGETASFVFGKDGSLKMIQGDMVLDDSSAGGKVTWHIDDGHDPMHLDFVLTESSGETEVLPLIVQFISDTKIQLRMSDDTTSRPIEFSDSDEVDQITLTKQ